MIKYNSYQNPSFPYSRAHVCQYRERQVLYYREHKQETMFKPWRELHCENELPGPVNHWQPSCDEQHWKQHDGHKVWMFRYHRRTMHTQVCPESGLPSRILTCTELKGHWRLFVLVSFIYIFLLATYARLSWILNFRVHVKLFYRIVSYRHWRVFFSAVVRRLLRDQLHIQGFYRQQVCTAMAHVTWWRGALSRDEL